MSIDEQFQVDNADVEEQSPAELRTQIDILAEENRQLRESYTQAKKTQYQQTAIGLFLIGLLAIVCAAFFTRSRSILLILGGIGIYGGVLTYYITPERFVSADVGSQVYKAFADNEAALIAELGLSDTHIYVPTANENGVRLFVPQRETEPLPSKNKIQQTLVVSDTGEAHGVAFEPSGERLFDSFTDALAGSPATTADELASQLSDAVVEQFELAQAAVPESTTDGRQVTIGITAPAYGSVDSFDHPISSLFATGFADILQVPVFATTTQSDDGEVDYIVTCRWEESISNNSDEQ